MLSYHAQTMHSYLSIRKKTHTMDWSNQPKTFKIYPSTYERFALDTQLPLHQFLYLIGGVTATKSYPGVTYALRTNPSAGALYPTEVYVQIRGVESFKNGIYHLSTGESSLVLLHPLDEEEGVEHALHVKRVKGFVFMFSALYYRSSWKYGNRAFRYCLNDTGHMIGTLEASCYLNDKSYRILYGGDKETISKSFGFHKEELYLASVIVGEEEPFTCKALTMQLPYVNGTGTFERNSLIEEAYAQTLHPSAKPQTTLPRFDVDTKRFLHTIWQRRSIREFTQMPMHAKAFQSVITFISEPIASDVDEEIEIYAVINRMEGMWQGLWKEGKYLKSGDFARKAGYLCLEQALGAQSGVTFFLVGESHENYQALMQKAGIIGHRLYLISNCLGLGCSGIGAYYDEEVAEFLETKGMILYALAIGN